MNVKKSSLNEYRARVLLAINFINENLSEKLTLEEISSRACFSQYHFHRIFTLLVGETPVDYVLRVRLDKAANLLVHNPSLTVTEISVMCGFSSSTVFSRAFKKRFGVPATKWAREACSNEKSRNCKVESKNGENADASLNYFTGTLFENNLRRSSMKVEIKSLPGYHLAYYPQLDGYDEAKIGAAWDKLCQWGQSQNLLNKETVFIGISFDNPKITPADKCRYYACITVPEGTTPPKGFGIYDIPPVKCASARYIGKGKDMEQAWNQLYAGWLVNSNFEPVDIPCFDIYYETPETNKEGNFVMDLCVPVK